MRELISGCEVVNGSQCDCFEDTQAWPYAIKTLIAIIVMAGKKMLNCVLF